MKSTCDGSEPGRRWDIHEIEKTESEESKEIGHEVRLEMSYCAASL